MNKLSDDLKRFNSFFATNPGSDWKLVLLSPSKSGGKFWSVESYIQPDQVLARYGKLKCAGRTKVYSWERLSTLVPEKLRKGYFIRCIECGGEIVYLNEDEINVFGGSRSYAEVTGRPQPLGPKSPLSELSELMKRRQLSSEW